MSNHKLVLSVFALLLSNICFSQQNQKSVRIEKCNWNPQTKDYVNCTSQKLINTINIDEQSKMIFIKNDKSQSVFKIMNREKKKSGNVFYTVIAASGISEQMEFVPSKKQIILTETPPLNRITYYIK